MKRKIKILIVYFLFQNLFANHVMQAQVISAPVIDTALTTSKIYFYNGEIVVPYSNGNVSILNNAEIEFLSTTEVTLLPGFTVSVDSGCGEFVAGIKDCPSLEIFNDIKNVSCFGGFDGEVMINISGLIPPYQFFWPDKKTESMRKYLKADNYVVNVLDNAGCIYYDSILIDQPELIELTISTTPSVCGDSTGSAELFVSGGTSSYSYYWRNSLSSEKLAFSLPSGHYDVTVIDSNNCVVTDEFNISDFSGPTFAISVLNHESCFGNRDGMASIDSTSGISPFTYFLSDEIISGNFIDNLRSGIFQVCVSDSFGCKTFDQFEILSPNPIQIDASISPTICGQYTGNVSIKVNGGSGLYNYQWSNGVTESNLQNLGAGIFTVVVSDSQGCSNSQSVQVESIGGPEILTHVLENVSCFGRYDGSGEVEVLSGVGPFSFIWSYDSVETATISNLPAGDFYIYVTDSNGCSSKSLLSIDEPPELQAAFYYKPPSSDISSDGQAASVVSGGIPPYSYSWERNGQTTPIIDGLMTGEETLLVTDNSGCQSVDIRKIRAAMSFCNRTSTTPTCVPSTIPSCGTSPCILDIVTDFGADPSGITNSQCAFEAASDFFNARQGNGTLVIPAGNYMVGQQNPVSPPYHPFWNTGNDVLCFENCSNLIIQGAISTSGIESKVKFKDCMMYGLFDPVTGERWIGDSRDGIMGCNYLLYSKMATPGNFLVLSNCNNVLVKFLEVNGNSDHISYGGHYCDGIQAPATGIILNSSVNVSIDNVNMHHFGQDGISLSELVLFHERKFVNINISNSKFNWNGRVGFNWNSGRGVNVVSCEFNYNGLGRFGMAAYDGVDFENDGHGGPVELGNFVKCDFLFNYYAGIECNLQQARYVRDMTFTSCNFASGSNYNGSSYAAIPGGKNFDFKLCNFYGALSSAYHARVTRRSTNNDNVKFRGIAPFPTPQLPGCTFNEEFRSYSMNADVNDECYTGLTNTGHHWLIEFSAARVLFQNCIFISNRQMRLIHMAGGAYLAPFNYAEIENCNLYNYGLTGSTNLGTLYATRITSSNLFVRASSGQDIVLVGNVTGSFNRSPILSTPIPFCKPKYQNPPYPNKVLDAFNCDSCLTLKPQFCPEDTSVGCDPCPRLYEKIIKESKEILLTVVPNPAKSKILVSNLDVNASLKIYSLLGKCIFTTFNFKEQLEIDISNFQSGIYLVQNGRSQHGKFVKSD
jgi:hypothetical protein